MRCPTCKHSDTQVIESREANDSKEIRRRRQCKKCNYRFTTFERIENSTFIVIKKDKTREPYNREKLMKGIWKACEKRPISEETIEKFLLELEEKWTNGRKREIPSNEIGMEIMKLLKKLDEIAYIRFASVYRQFKDLETFRNELQKLLEK